MTLDVLKQLPPWLLVVLALAGIVYLWRDYDTFREGQSTTHDAVESLSRVISPLVETTGKLQDDQKEVRKDLKEIVKDLHQLEIDVRVLQEKSSRTALPPKTRIREAAPRPEAQGG